MIPLGVRGAALATVISQGVSVVLSVWWLFKKMSVIYQLDEQGNSYLALSQKHMKTACIIGVPLGLEYSVTSIGNVVLQSSINSMGAVVAAAQICGERIRAIAWAVLFILKKPLVYLLLGEVTSIEAVKAVEYLTVITTLFVFHGSLMVFRNTVQGMGYSASALAASVMEITGRSGAGILAVYFNSFFIICVSSPTAWILAMLMCIILYIYYMKKEKNAVHM